MTSNFRQRRIEEERLRTEGRLPPGQSLTIKFPILHHGTIPPFNPSTWTFRIWGEVEDEITWNWDKFQHLPRKKVTMDVHCVTRWSKFDTVWEGVSVKNLVEEKIIKLKPAARYVIQHAEPGYTTNLPLKIILQDNFLLATHYNGEPLTPDHGYPLRAIVGDIVGRDELETPYFWKGAKWLRGLEFSSEDIPGFWERAGYHNEANVWKEERFG